MTKQTEQNYDIVAVNIKTGAERFMGRNKSLANAEACVEMAIMRRGVEVEFYKTEPSGYVLKEGTEAMR